MNTEEGEEKEEDHQQDHGSFSCSPVIGMDFEFQLASTLSIHLECPPRWMSTWVGVCSQDLSGETGDEEVRFVCWRRAPVLLQGCGLRHKIVSGVYDVAHTHREFAFVRFGLASLLESVMYVDC